MKGIKNSQTIENKELYRSFFLIIYFFLGFFSIITQTIVLRELVVVVHGNETILGISLAHWLVGVFVGALLGGYISDRIKNVLRIFICSVIAMCLISPLTITIIRNLYYISGTSAGTYISFFKVFVYSGLIIFPFSFFIGFTFPHAAKLQTTKTFRNIKKVANISNVYIFEALGSLFGGILISFFLIGRFNSYLIISFSVIPLLIILEIATIKLKYPFISSFIAVLIIIYIFSLTPYGNAKLDKTTVKKRWESFSNSHLICSTDSIYQNIELGKIYEQFNLYTNGQLSSIFPEENDNSILASHIISQHTNPKKILVIGETISGLAKHLLKFRIENLTSIEIDTLLIKTIKKYLPESYKNVFSDNRFSIHIQDGRRFVKNIIKKKSITSFFDIVFINMPEPCTILLNRYYTLEFFQDISKILTKNGILALRITSSENYAYGIVSDYTASIYNTLKKVYPYIIIAPGTKNFFFVSKSPVNITDSPEILATRYIKTGIQPQKLSLIFRSIYPEEKTKFIKNRLNANINREINTDNRPISTFYFNKILGWITGINTEKFFTIFENLKLNNLILILSILLLISLLFMKFNSFKKKYHTRFHIIVSVINGGIAGMSIEFLIIYSFQKSFGYIYQLIGFIIALFMLGLPIGAFISNYILNKKRISKKIQVTILCLIQITIALISLLFPYLTELFDKYYTISKILIFLFTVGVGILIGAIFPLSLNLYLGTRGKTGKTAGIIDGYDHFGGAIGAFFSGSIFLPILGITGISTFIAALSFATALLLIVNLFYSTQYK